jgi:O-antigen ligase
MQVIVLFFFLLLLLVILFKIPINFLLIIGIPVLVILSNANIVPSLYGSGESGGANIRIQDILVLLLIIRIVISNFQNKLTVKYANFDKNKIFYSNKPNTKLVSNFIRITAILWFILLLATIFAGLRFGQNVFIGEIISLLRFTTQLMLFFMIIYISKEKQIDDYHKYLNILGYIILMSACVSYVLYTFFGIQFGDVQYSLSTDSVRFFGVIGDSIGFIVTLFCFQQLITGQLILAFLNASVVVLSATRGAVISLVLGSLIVFITQKNKNRFGIRPKKFVFYIIFILASLMLISYFSDFWAIFESIINASSSVTNRFISKESSFGLLQRELSISLAFEVFVNNFFTGVGYTGFRFIAPQYENYKYIPNFIDASNAVATTNNQYLQFATDAGIFGLLIFIILMASSLKLLKLSGKQVSPELGSYFMAGRIWLWSQLIANQGASWMLPSSLTSLILWIILAMAAANLVNQSINQAVYDSTDYLQDHPKQAK